MDGQSTSPQGLITEAATLLEVGNDPAYDALLAERKHLTTLSAPPAFRALLVDLSPFRFDLVRGIDLRHGSLVYYWFCGEFGADGTPEEVRTRITASLARSGFTESSRTTADNGLPEIVLRNEKAAFVLEVTLNGPERFTGTRTPRSGGSLLFHAAWQTEAPRLSWEELTAAFPVFNAEAIPEKLRALFPGQTLVLADFGGTWKDHYDWMYVFRFTDAREADAFLLRCTDTAADLGFTKESEHRGIDTYMKTGASGPVLYLGKDGENDVSFRIQPRM